MIPRRPLLHLLLPLAAALLLLPAPATSMPQLPGAAVRAKPFTDDLKWVRGVNYVPSSAHNDMGIWLDYDSALVHQELGYAGKQGFNAVRVFLHWLAWQHDPAVLGFPGSGARRPAQGAVRRAGLLLRRRQRRGVLDPRRQVPQHDLDP